MHTEVYILNKISLVVKVSLSSNFVIQGESLRNQQHSKLGNAYFK